MLHICIHQLHWLPEHTVDDPPRSYFTPQPYRRLIATFATFAAAVHSQKPNASQSKRNIVSFLIFLTHKRQNSLLLHLQTSPLLSLDIRRK